MTSTPSASALSAVLRCRGNIWTRNTPSKRPATAACSLGLAGGALRDSPDKRARPTQTSAWEAFVKAERVVVTRKLSVEYRSPRVPANILREKDFRKIDTFDCLKLSQLPGDAHSVPLARRLTREQPKWVQIMLKYETHPAHVCKMLFAQEVRSYPSGVLKVSITSRCLLENAGQLGKTLRSTCLTLTELVSEIMLLWRSSSSSSSPDGASRQHRPCQQHEENIKDSVQKANGQTHSPTDLTSSKGNFDCGQKITEDKPD